MSHRRFAAFLAACFLVPGAGAARADNGRPADRQIEQYLVDIPTAAGALDDSAKLNEENHYAGSSGDYKMAVWMRDLLLTYGFNARLEPFQAEVPHLKRAVVQLMVRPTVDFDLREVPIAQDPDGSRSDALLPFNAWSGSGDVTAPLVYAGQGLDADYATLAQAGVSLQGRIALVRYGAEFRGALARRAVEHGAAGVILYSDPAGRDGVANGSAYPDGPYRPLGAVQRGSLGQPPLDVPVLPVSALTAQRLLQAIAGKPAPPGSWRGGLDASYAIGETSVPVHLRVDETFSTETLWNTVGILPGSDSTHNVVLGGHRDAWVYGVTDNGSGISALLEAAHALGYIYKAGWRPAYSIVIAGWDGEEIGEVGSNQYVRAHYDELSRSCIAYVNADEVATGSFFHVNGTAAIASLVPVIARRIPDPHDRTQTLWEKWRQQPGGVRIGAPGGGSDHEPFLYLVGIPVLDGGFAGPFGVYHSAYDDLRYAEFQADPHFVYHRAMAQLLALTAFRMTLGPLPYSLSAYAQPMHDAIAQMQSANGTGTDLTPISQAIDRFSAADAAWERTSTNGGHAIDAVHRLNLLFYGRSNYAAVAFPKLAGAMASGNAQAAQAAVSETSNALDAIAAMLAQ